MELSRLAEPFPLEDIEWRVAQAGMSGKVWCRVLAYVTARAIQNRFDEVCGIENWKLEEPRVIEVNGKSAFSCGLSIYIQGSGWITKWDVAEPTQIEPVKGGWSGAVKRAASCWGAGRYLYYLEEAYAEVSDEKPVKPQGWHRARLPKSDTYFWWKEPDLPGWALPKEEETEVSLEQLNDLKRLWKLKFALNVKNPADLREGFTRFVKKYCGDFPVADHTCWTADALLKCSTAIEEQDESSGIDSDIPFGK